MIIQQFSVSEQDFANKGGFLVQRLFTKAMLEVERKDIKKPVRLFYKGTADGKLNFNLETLDYTYLVTDDLAFIEAKLDDNGSIIVPTVNEISQMSAARIK